MLRTKNLITSIEDVPIEWVYEFYLSLPEPLTGQDVNIKSMLSPSDTNPSFFVYYSRLSNKYRWKCFSSGKQGDTLELVKELFNLDTRFEAGTKIINDYNNYLLNDENIKQGFISRDIFKLRDKFRVKAVRVRQWSLGDKEYWTQYKIGSAMLERFNVKPLEHFVLTKSDRKDDVVVKGTRIYGYFRNDGSLYKIYQPMRREQNKFFKVKRYIQGVDQLTYKVPYLVICSSLKDAMCFLTLGFRNVEVIAPDSENIIIPEKSIQKLQSKYKAICTLLDNDRAGIDSMLIYKERYDIPSVHLKYEKDLAECVKIHGIDNTREILQPILYRALKTTKKLEICDL